LGDGAPDGLAGAGYVRIEGYAVLVVELVLRGATGGADSAVRGGDRSLTFAEVDEANRTAHVFAGLCVARGARISHLVGNGLPPIRCETPTGHIQDAQQADLRGGGRAERFEPSPGCHGPRWV
jgi:hypothetical protein